MSTMASQFTSPTVGHACLLKRLLRRRSKKTSKLRVTDLWAGNSPLTGEFPAQMASNAENVTIWWRHHGYDRVRRAVFQISRFRINFDDQMTSFKMDEEISQNLATFRVFVCTYLRNAFPAHNQQTFVLLSQTLVLIAKNKDHAL